MMSSRKTLKWLLVFVGLATGVVVALTWPERPPAHPYKSFVSPDRRFKIVVIGHKTLVDRVLPVAPGQGGDVAGIVYLVDVERDRVVKKIHTALADEVTDVSWSETNVSEGFVADWELPKR
jgi:hypothetical protein